MKESSQGEKYRRVLWKLEERWREGQVLILSIDGIGREGFSINTEWVKPRPKQYCCYYYHYTPPCHEAYITSVDTKLNVREWEGKGGGKEGQCKGFYYRTRFTNLLISKVTTIILSKDKYWQGNWQFAAPESILGVFKKKELHQLLAPPALTRLACPPAPAFRGSVSPLHANDPLVLQHSPLTSVTKYFAPWYVCCVAAYVVHET